MKICVVGCGAMGSIYAALLASVGHDVSAVDRNTEHIEAINRDGLHVRGASGDRTVRISAYLEPPAEHFDLVILAVKARHVGEAATTMASMLVPHSQVLTIQNGLGSAEIVAQAVGSARLGVGVAQGFGASLPEPGCAHHNAMKAIRIGAFDPTSEFDATAMAALWTQAGFETEAVADIAAVQWEKLICNVAYSAPCAITGLTVGEVMDHPDVGAVSRAAATEAWTVARALGVAIDVDDPVALVREFAGRMPAARPSVLLDLQAGRISEVDVINGAVPREGEKVGVDAPVNRTLTALVRTLERRT